MTDTLPDTLDATVQRADPDRWLSSRFIGDEAQRADVVALYAFDHELSQIAVATREPLMAEIRLTWWSEALDEIFTGKPPRGHPALAALAQAIQRRGLARAPLDAMIEARFQAIETPVFADAAAVEAWLDATDGAVMALAVAVLARADALTVRPAAQAWGLARLLRRLEQGGESILPEGWNRAEIERRARLVLVEARSAAKALPVAAFPAVAHLALARPYLAGRRPLGLEKRLRLTWAVLSGGV